MNDALSTWMTPAQDRQISDVVTHEQSRLRPRWVFVAHELEGRSFKEMAAETGVSVNTLLSRKHYAVLRLRERLQPVHDEFSKDRSRS